MQGRLELHPRRDGEQLGKEVPLDVPRHGHLAREVLGVAQAPAVQRRAQTSPQHGRPEVPADIVIGARLEALRQHIEVVHHRHHDDRDRRQVRIVPERLEKPRAGHPGRVRIQQHQVEPLGPELGERLATLVGRSHHVPFRLHVAAERVAIGVRMPDDQHSRLIAVGRRRGRSRKWWSRHP